MKKIAKIYQVAKEHLVFGLIGQNVLRHVETEHANAKGNVLVQEIVLDIVKRKKIVWVCQIAKEHSVNGLNGPNVQYFLTKENNNAQGTVMEMEIVMNLLKMKEIVRIYQIAKEHLVNGQIGQIFLLLVENFEDVHGNALVLEIVKAW